jgi:hypothetical protein
MSLHLIQHLQTLIPQQQEEITKLKSWFNTLTIEQMEEDEDMEDYIQQNMDLLAFMERNLSYLTYKLQRNIILHEEDLSADEEDKDEKLADYNTVKYYG